MAAPSCWHSILNQWISFYVMFNVAFQHEGRTVICPYKAWPIALTVLFFLSFQLCWHNSSSIVVIFLFNLLCCNKIETHIFVNQIVKISNSALHLLWWSKPVYYEIGHNNWLFTGSGFQRTGFHKKNPVKHTKVTSLIMRSKHGLFGNWIPELITKCYLGQHTKNQVSLTNMLIIFIQCIHL